MRLVTRSDFDGLACAVLLEEQGIVDDYLFAHPKDLQDGKIKVTDNDILANVPYVPGAGLWFDHHTSEQERLESNLRFNGASIPLPSCARVIWEYYGGEKSFDSRLLPMMEAVDKVDSANLTAEDILHPEGWILLGYVMDPRTGLGRFHDYRISNYQLMLDMIGYCRRMTAAQILQIEDVRERTQRYFEQAELFQQMLQRCTEVHGNLAVIDLRHEETIYAGNRFMVYALFPDCNISMQVMWGFKRQNIVFTVGHSITNRTSNTDVGRLLLSYGGGGHRGVGTCQIDLDEAERVRNELIAKINADG
jgi:nanoRNase/pAp phosphatase (c-di-AMP/oligoRNAs hydrolase)